MAETTYDGTFAFAAAAGLTLTVMFRQLDGTEVAVTTNVLTNPGGGNFYGWDGKLPAQTRGWLVFRDATPEIVAMFGVNPRELENGDIPTSDLTAFTGRGSVSVDHNYGGADALSYQDAQGNGIPDAVVRAYLTSDYDAGDRGITFIQAESVTAVAGRWGWPMLLNPGAYTLVYFKAGAYLPAVTTVTVS